MSKEKISSLLAEQGKTAGNIAVKCKVSYTAVYRVMDCSSNSRRIRLEIARTLNKSPSFLWGGELPPQVLLVDDYEYMHNSAK